MISFPREAVSRPLQQSKCEKRVPTESLGKGAASGSAGVGVEGGRVGRLCLTHAISTINSAIAASDDLSAPKCCQKQPHYRLAFGLGAALCLFACPAGGEGVEGRLII